MALLIKIVEILLIIAVARSFLRLLSPAPGAGKTPERHPKKPDRFNGDRCDISDADYEELP